MALYPLKFKTIFKDKIWGGQKIKTILGKDFSPLPNCGETWELSGVTGDISEVSNGPLSGSKITEVIEKYGQKLLGKRIVDRFGSKFPLLIKFIDAADDLSIQVHPDDKLARARHNSFGKAEMWYIIQADEGSTLIAGFNKSIDKVQFMDYYNNGRLMEILNWESVSAGDAFYLPAGRIHTIGKGLLLAEIQQTSDVTYRIYDFDRKDNQGNLRELHVEAALDAMDYQHYDQYKTPYRDQIDDRSAIVKSPYFTTNKLTLTHDFDVDHTGLDCFKIYVAVEGEGSIVSNGNITPIQKGEVVLIPAEIEQLKLETSNGLTLLESYIDPS